MNKMYGVFFLLFSSAASATDFGLGVSLRSGDTTVYAPINVSPTLQVEPFVTYSTDERKTAGVSGTYTNKALDLGIGIFKRVPLQNSMHWYYGGRVAYLRTEAKSEIEYLGYQESADRTQNGYAIAPTLGLDYAINEKLSAAAEVAWSYTSLREKSTYSYAGISGASLTPQQLAALAAASPADYGSSRSTATSARIVVRYYF